MGQHHRTDLVVIVEREYDLRHELAAVFPAHLDRGTHVAAPPASHGASLWCRVRPLCPALRHVGRTFSECCLRCQQATARGWSSCWVGPGNDCLSCSMSI